MIVIIYDQGVQTPVEIPDSDLPLWALAEMCRVTQPPAQQSPPPPLSE